MWRPPREIWSSSTSSPAMPKIRIYDPASGFRLWLPLPYRLLVNLCLRRTWVLSAIDGSLKALQSKQASSAEGHGPLEQRIRMLRALQTVAEGLDYGALRASLTHIEPYRGLVLVDVQASDGTVVHISL